MTFLVNEREEQKVPKQTFLLGFGRGRPRAELLQTPTKGADNVSSPAFSSTRIAGSVPNANVMNDSVLGASAVTDSNLNTLITQIAQQVGQTIKDQLRSEMGQSVNNTPAQSSVGQLSSEPTYLNLSGAKFVLQPDAREPPVFRGDGLDKNTVTEWREMMEVYFKKRATPLNEQYSEIMSKLMGKAKDVVRITLRSNPSLKPLENPNIVYDILRQHFSDVTYSCMPLADFYSTVPLPGEAPVEYWLRLNKAVDAAEEGLKRLGRQMTDPCHEAAMMFVKYCPDPTLAAIFKFKAPDKWTASEVQEHIDRYQIEAKEQSLSKPKRSQPITVHVQTPESSHVETVSHASEPVKQNEKPKSSCNDECLQMLVSIFDRALSQNSHAVSDNIKPDQIQKRSCRVCQSFEHSTLAHCRQKRLCLACFLPNHIKKNCPNVKPNQNSGESPQQNTQPLN